MNVAVTPTRSGPSRSGRRVFEDVAVGDEIGPLFKGPLTTAHLMRWSAAMENWHKIHYDLPFATGHDKLPGLLINGSLKQQLIAQLLKDWAGPTGWVWKMRFQFRAMNLVGERLEIWARIKDKRREREYGLVELVTVVDEPVIDFASRDRVPGGLGEMVTFTEPLRALLLPARSVT